MDDGPLIDSARNVVEFADIVSPDSPVIVLMWEPTQGGELSEDVALICSGHFTGEANAYAVIEEMVRSWKSQMDEGENA